MKRTYQPSKLILKRRHGFLVRSQSDSGRKIIFARIRKKRKYLTK